MSFYTSPTSYGRSRSNLTNLSPNKNLAHTTPSKRFSIPNSLQKPVSPNLEVPKIEAIVYKQKYPTLYDKFVKENREQQIRLQSRSTDPYKDTTVYPDHHLSYKKDLPIVEHPDSAYKSNPYVEERMDDNIRYLKGRIPSPEWNTLVETTEEQLSHNPPNPLPLPSMQEEPHQSLENKRVHDLLQNKYHQSTPSSITKTKTVTNNNCYNNTSNLTSLYHNNNNNNKSPFTVGYSKNIPTYPPTNLNHSNLNSEREKLSNLENTIFTSTPTKPYNNNNNNNLQSSPFSPLEKSKISPDNRSISVTPEKKRQYENNNPHISPTSNFWNKMKSPQLERQEYKSRSNITKKSAFDKPDNDTSIIVLRGRIFKRSDYNTNEEDLKLLNDKEKSLLYKVTPFEWNKMIREAKIKKENERKRSENKLPFLTKYVRSDYITDVEIENKMTEEERNMKYNISPSKWNKLVGDKRLEYENKKMEKPSPRQYLFGQSKKPNPDILYDKNKPYDLTEQVMINETIFNKSQWNDDPLIERLLSEEERKNKYKMTPSRYNRLLEDKVIQHERLNNNNNNKVNINGVLYDKSEYKTDEVIESYMKEEDRNKKYKINPSQWNIIFYCIQRIHGNELRSKTTTPIPTTNKTTTATVRPQQSKTPSFKPYSSSNDYYDKNKYTTTPELERKLSTEQLQVKNKMSPTKWNKYVYEEIEKKDREMMKENNNKKLTPVPSPPPIPLNKVTVNGKEYDKEEYEKHKLLEKDLPSAMKDKKYKVTPNEWEKILFDNINNQQKNQQKYLQHLQQINKNEPENEEKKDKSCDNKETPIKSKYLFSKSPKFQNETVKKGMEKVNVDNEEHHKFEYLTNTKIENTLSPEQRDNKYKQKPSEWNNTIRNKQREMINKSTPPKTSYLSSSSSSSSSLSDLLTPTKNILLKNEKYKDLTKSLSPEVKKKIRELSPATSTLSKLVNENKIRSKTEPKKSNHSNDDYIHVGGDVYKLSEYDKYSYLEQYLSFEDMKKKYKIPMLDWHALLLSHKPKSTVSDSLTDNNVSNEKKYDESEYDLYSGLEIGLTDEEKKMKYKYTPTEWGNYLLSRTKKETSPHPPQEDVIPQNKEQFTPKEKEKIEKHYDKYDFVPVGKSRFFAYKWNNDEEIERLLNENERKMKYNVVPEIWNKLLQDKKKEMKVKQKTESPLLTQPKVSKDTIISDSDSNNDENEEVKQLPYKFTIKGKKMEDNKKVEIPIRSESAPVMNNNNVSTTKVNEMVKDITKSLKRKSLDEIKIDGKVCHPLEWKTDEEIESKMSKSEKDLKYVISPNEWNKFLMDKKKGQNEKQQLPPPPTTTIKDNKNTIVLDKKENIVNNNKKVDIPPRSESTPVVKKERDRFERVEVDGNKYSVSLWNNNEEIEAQMDKSEKELKYVITPYQWNKYLRNKKKEIEAKKSVLSKPAIIQNQKADSEKKEDENKEEDKIELVPVEDMFGGISINNEKYYDYEYHSNNYIESQMTEEERGKKYKIPPKEWNDFLEKKLKEISNRSFKKIEEKTIKEKEKINDNMSDNRINEMSVNVDDDKSKLTPSMIIPTTANRDSTKQKEIKNIINSHMLNMNEENEGYITIKDKNNELHKYKKSLYASDSLAEGNMSEEERKMKYNVDPSDWNKLVSKRREEINKMICTTEEERSIFNSLSSASSSISSSLSYSSARQNEKVTVNGKKYHKSSYETNEEIENKMNEEERNKKYKVMPYEWNKILKNKKEEFSKKSTSNIFNNNNLKPSLIQSQQQQQQHEIPLPPSESHLSSSLPTYNTKLSRNNNNKIVNDYNDDNKVTIVDDYGNVKTFDKNLYHCDEEIESKMSNEERLNKRKMTPGKWNKYLEDKKNEISKQPQESINNESNKITLDGKIYDRNEWITNSSIERLLSESVKVKKYSITPSQWNKIIETKKASLENPTHHKPYSGMKKEEEEKIEVKKEEYMNDDEVENILSREERDKKYKIPAVEWNRMIRKKKNELNDLKNSLKDDKDKVMVDNITYMKCLWNNNDEIELLMSEEEKQKKYLMSPFRWNNFLAKKTKEIVSGNLNKPIKEEENKNKSSTIRNKHDIIKIDGRIYFGNNYHDDEEVESQLNESERKLKYVITPIEWNKLLEDKKKEIEKVAKKEVELSPPPPKVKDNAKSVIKDDNDEDVLVSKYKSYKKENENKSIPSRSHSAPVVKKERDRMDKIKIEGREYSAFLWHNNEQIESQMSEEERQLKYVIPYSEWNVFLQRKKKEIENIRKEKEPHITPITPKPTFSIDKNDILNPPTQPKQHTIVDNNNNYYRFNTPTKSRDYLVDADNDNDKVKIEDEDGNIRVFDKNLYHSDEEIESKMSNEERLNKRKMTPGKWNKYLEDKKNELSKPPEKALVKPPLSPPPPLQLPSSQANQNYKIENDISNHFIYEKKLDSSNDYKIDPFPVPPPQQQQPLKSKFVKQMLNEEPLVRDEYISYVWRYLKFDLQKMKDYVDLLFPRTLTDADYNEIRNNPKAKLAILKSLYLYLKSIGINLNKDKCEASSDKDTHNFKDYSFRKVNKFLESCGMTFYNDIVMNSISNNH